MPLELQDSDTCVLKLAGTCFVLQSQLVNTAAELESVKNELQESQSRT